MSMSGSVFGNSVTVLAATYSVRNNPVPHPTNGYGRRSQVSARMPATSGMHSAK